jgi:hypothetical protein
MSTPSIQTLITQAQQVLNLKSSNEIRATLAAVLANANVGTPLNPNLTTQQLWDEFYEIVRQPSDDIMSIITDQMMRMVFSPPAPGGAGADKQVIFNDGGVLAGDAGLMYNKATDALTITGALTVDTSTLVVDATNDVVGIGTTTPNSYAFNDPAKLVIANTGTAGAGNTFTIASGSTGFGQIAFANGTSGTSRYNGYIKYSHSTNAMEFYTTAGTLGMTLNTAGNLAFPSGKGIDFSAVTGGTGTATANVLNDYEEGTWTGTMKGFSADPTTPVTATGRYTKIGRNVTVQISFEGVNTTGASGACYITGLPFANGNVRTVGSAASYLGLTFTGTLVAIVDGSGTQIDFVDTRSNAVWVQAPHNAGSGRTILASLTYTV